MLSVKRLLEKLADSMVIKTSGNWQYITLGKLFIGAYSTTGPLTIGTQVGQVYQTAANSTIALPLTLSSNYYSNVVVSSSSYSVWSVMYGASNTVLSYRALSAASRSSANYSIRALTIGSL